MVCPWRRICLLRGLQEAVQNRCLRTAIFDASWLLANRGGVEIERTFIADRFSPSRTGGTNQRVGKMGHVHPVHGLMVPQCHLSVSSVSAACPGL